MSKLDEMTREELLSLVQGLATQLQSVGTVLVNLGQAAQGTAEAIGATMMHLATLTEEPGTVERIDDGG